MGLLPALVTGGLSLLSGLAGKKEQKAPETKFEFTKLRDAAQAAGFNPLTALRATGGQPTSVHQPVPPLSSASIIANALGTGAETYFANQPDPVRDERNKLEIELMKQELARGNKTWSGAPATSSTPYQAFPENPPASLSSGEMRPKGRPTFDSLGWIPVFDPSGVQRVIPRRLANRLDVKPHEALLSDDWVRIKGEIGEAEIAGSTFIISDAAGLNYEGNKVSRYYDQRPPKAVIREDERNKKYNSGRFSHKKDARN